ncbi:MAG: glycosyltransferase family 2 protein [Myxococcota bacterium]
MGEPNGNGGPEHAQPRVVVVVPCLDEELTIGKVVRDFRKALPEAEIYVFDNASSDATAEIARSAGARVVTSPLRGKGNVIRHMSDVIDADVYVLVDGDDTYPADAAPALIERFVRDDLDMLVATRLESFDDDSFRRFHHLGNHFLSWIIRVAYRTRCTDVLSGYRILSGDLVRIVRLRTRGFEVETELTLQALTKRLSFAEMPIAYRSRPEGSESKLSTWSDSILILRCMFLLFKDYKPMLFFGATAALFLFLSLVIGSAPIADYLEHQYVYHVPRAILAAALAILSLVSLTAGLILDTIAKLHQESIEIWRHYLRERG